MGKYQDSGDTEQEGHKFTKREFLIDGERVLLEPLDEARLPSDYEIVQGVFKDNHIYLPKTIDSEELHSKNYFGREKEETYQLNLFESLILITRNRIAVQDHETSQVLGFDALVEKGAQENPRFWIQYLVYRDLRARGFVVRAGFGNRMDFRVYPRGTQQNTHAAKYFIIVLEEAEEMPLNLLETMAQQALSNRKTLLLALVDSLGDVTYYSCSTFNLDPLTKKNDFFDEK